MSASPSCSCESQPRWRFDRRGGFVHEDSVPTAAARPEVQPVLEGVLLTNARRPSATATCGCGCGGSCAAESDEHPCKCGNTTAPRVRRMERPFQTKDPRLRLWQLQQEQPGGDLEARIAGLEATGRRVRGDPRATGERTWTVPTTSGLRMETTGMGDSARFDRFGRGASERQPEGLQGPFANALVPPGVGADHHPGWGDLPRAFPRACDMGPDEAPVCAREASMEAHPGEVYTPEEMIVALRGEVSSSHLKLLSEYVGATLSDLKDLGTAGDAGDYGYIDPNTGEAIGPAATCADVTHCGSNASDGDGIDFKGLRPRTPTSGQLTLVHENLFLFCEGPAILSHYGTLGLDIARNIFAGNANGISVGADTYLFHDEWTVHDDATGYDYLEGGCYRIYRNLFIKNNRADKSCNQRGSGAGITMDLAVRWSFKNNEYNPNCNFEEEALGMHMPVRYRDVWIVNNTFHEHGEHAIAIYRGEYEENVVDPYDASIFPQRPAVLQDFTILNNIFSDSYSREVEPLEADRKAEGLGLDVHLAFFVGGSDDLSNQAQAFDPDFEAPTIEIDHNLYYPTFTCGDNGSGGTECSLLWETNAEHWGLERFRQDPPAQEAHGQEADSPTDYLEFFTDFEGSTTRWNWFDGTWDADWSTDGTNALWRGPLAEATLPTYYDGGAPADEPHWASLPPDWTPLAYVPSASSPAIDQAKLDTGLYDLGWYRRTGGLEGGEVVDVGQGPDLLFRFKNYTVTSTGGLPPGFDVEPAANQSTGDIGALNHPVLHETVDPRQTWFWGDKYGLGPGPQVIIQPIGPFDLPTTLDPPTKDLFPPVYIDPGLWVSREFFDQLLRYDWSGSGASQQRADLLRLLLQSRQQAFRPTGGDR